MPSPNSNYSFNLTNKLCSTVRERYSTIPGDGQSSTRRYDERHFGSAVDDVTKNDGRAKRVFSKFKRVSDPRGVPRTLDRSTAPAVSVVSNDNTMTGRPLNTCIHHLISRIPLLGQVFAIVIPPTRGADNPCFSVALWVVPR